MGDVILDAWLQVQVQNWICEANVTHQATRDQDIQVPFRLHDASLEEIEVEIKVEAGVDVNIDLHLEVGQRWWRK